MKKLFLILVVVLVSGLMFVGCPDKDDDDDNKNPSNGKVIEDKYRGKFQRGKPYFILSKDKLTYNDGYDGVDSNEKWAYTEGNKLYSYYNKTWNLEFEFQDEDNFKRYIDGVLIEYLWTRVK